MRVFNRPALAGPRTQGNGMSRTIAIGIAVLMAVGLAMAVQHSWDSRRSAVSSQNAAANSEEAAAIAAASDAAFAASDAEPAADAEAATDAAHPSAPSAQPGQRATDNSGTMTRDDWIRADETYKAGGGGNCGLACEAIIRRREEGY